MMPAKVPFQLEPVRSVRPAGLVEDLPGLAPSAKRQHPLDGHGQEPRVVQPARPCRPFEADLDRLLERIAIVEGARKGQVGNADRNRLAQPWALASASRSTLSPFGSRR